VVNAVCHLLTNLRLSVMPLLTNPRLLSAPRSVKKQEEDPRFSEFLQEARQTQPKGRRGERTLDRNGQFADKSDDSDAEGDGKEAGSDDSDSDSDSNSEEEDELEIEDILNTKDVQRAVGEETNRIAIVNLDWDNIKVSSVSIHRKSKILFNARRKIYFSC
jgi:hypothetical protein